MDVPRLEPYDFERPAIVLMVLDALERAYLESDEQIDEPMQQEHLHAWYEDALLAAERVRDDRYTAEIMASLERARAARTARDRTTG